MVSRRPRAGAPGSLALALRVSGPLAAPPEGSSLRFISRAVASACATEVCRRATPPAAGSATCRRVTDAR